jgi:hypothetical protein
MFLLFIACDSGGGPIRGAGRVTPRGFCGRVATAFKVGIQTFTPPTDDGDAGDDDDAGDAGTTDDDASSLNDAGGDASNATVPPFDPDASTDAGTGGFNPPRKGRQSLFALTVRTGAGAGISLKDATITMKSGKMIGEPRQSELLAELDVDTSSITPQFSIEVKLGPESVRCSANNTLFFVVILRADGQVGSIQASASDGESSAKKFETLPNEL